MIAIVAGFAIVDAAVAAAFQATTRRAAITVCLVAVITFLKADLAWFDIIAHDAITTASHRAAPSAAITIFSVAIIAAFDAELDHSITAARRRTGA